MNIRTRLHDAFLVTAGLKSHPRADGIRALTLGVLVATSFCVAGAVRPVDAARLVANAPFDFDFALRAVALGWFESPRTQPVTLVDIDEATHAHWGNPPITPRDDLAKIIAAVAPAGAKAIVVDVDLSGGAEEDDADAAALAHYLSTYAGPTPIVLPRRLEPARDGQLPRATRSWLDDDVAHNPHVRWAHARFDTEFGGVVRHWFEAVPICNADGFGELLPSVATRVRDPAPVAVGTDARRPCDPRLGPQGARRLLIGPRMTGPQRRPAPDAQAVSALNLLEPGYALDMTQLFAHRVVVIGATHTAAGDLWPTPAGIVPGAELLANTIRYASVQSETRGGALKWAYRGLALLMFAWFAVMSWLLRGPAVLVAVAGGVLGLTALVLGVFNSLVVLDALEAAILLSILYKALESTGEAIAEYRVRRARHPKGLRGAVRTVAAGWVRPSESTTEEK